MSQFLKVCWGVWRQDKDKATLFKSWSCCSTPLLGDCTLIHLQCRNQSSLLSSYAHGANAERTQTFSFHLKITHWLFSLPCLFTPPLAYSLRNSFISQTSVGKRESLISQGLSFKYHYWNYMPIWVTADAAVLVWCFSLQFLL